MLLSEKNQILRIKIFDNLIQDFPILKGRF